MHLHRLPDLEGTYCFVWTQILGKKLFYFTDQEFLQIIFGFGIVAEAMPGSGNNVVFHMLVHLGCPKCERKRNAPWRK